MYMLDASSMVHAWENYPLANFPPFWAWMAAQIDLERISIPRAAYEEVGHKCPECKDWLKQVEIRRIDPTNSILQHALAIKGLLGIHNDAFHPKGVDENDIVIIATAKVAGWVLVSEEGVQGIRPKDRRRFKIPAVCGLPEVAVQHVTVIEMIRAENAVFG